MCVFGGGGGGGVGKGFFKNLINFCFWCIYIYKHIYVFVCVCVKFILTLRKEYSFRVLEKRALWRMVGYKWEKGTGWEKLHNEGLLERCIVCIITSWKMRWNRIYHVCIRSEEDNRKT